MERIIISRYPEEEVAMSQLHHLDDALDTLTFLKAEDLVAEQLKSQHQMTMSNAKRIAKRISSHANLAGQYATLSLNSPPEISFLPGYYCILNLAKIYCLAGPYSTEFDHHSRWHGATYNAQGKMSQSILTDEVRVRGGGALALFYKTLTNEPISTDRNLKLKDVYPIVPGIGSELTTITGEEGKSWFIEFYGKNNSGKILAEARVLTWGKDRQQINYSGSVRAIPCLKGFKKKPKVTGTFFKHFDETPGLTLKEEMRNVVRTEFLVNLREDQPCFCHEQSSVFPMPEEFASALAFFHLSSVCRYNPEFVDKLSKSKFWPMLLALRRHALFYFLLSTWSNMIQKNYFLYS